MKKYIYLLITTLFLSCGDISDIERNQQNLDALSSRQWNVSGDWIFTCPWTKTDYPVDGVSFFDTTWVSNGILEGQLDYNLNVHNTSAIKKLNCRVQVGFENPPLRWNGHIGTCTTDNNYVYFINDNWIIASFGSLWITGGSMVYPNSPCSINLQLRMQ